MENVNANAFYCVLEMLLIQIVNESSIHIHTNPFVDQLKLRRITRYIAMLIAKDVYLITGF